MCGSVGGAAHGKYAGGVHGKVAVVHGDSSFVHQSRNPLMARAGAEGALGRLGRGPT